MDATYNTNKLNLALSILSGVSNEGKNIILAVAFLSRETAENYSWLLRNLKEMNHGIEPTTIMTDFDSSMCQAIEQTYSKTTHMLC
jgi:transposase-like protein